MPLVPHLNNLDISIVRKALVFLDMLLRFFNGCYILRRQQYELHIRILDSKVQQGDHADLQKQTDTIRA